MNRKQRLQRIAALTKAEESNPERWIYLCYLSPDGEVFYCGLVIQARGPIDAASKGAELRSPRKSQVVARDIPDDRLPPEQFRNRLLTKEEIKEIWSDAMHVREMKP